MTDTIKTTFKSYYFDVSVKEQKTEYEKLCTELKAQGLKCFESWGGSGSHYMPEFSDKIVELEINCLFDNQWNTSADCDVPNRRVFDWAQDYPAGQYLSNKYIKRGHYLVQTEEMKQVREDNLKCGYCGKQEHKSTAEEFCKKCLDSAYLEEKNLPLLRMRKISDNSKRPELSDKEKAELMPRYIHAQTVATGSRNKARLEKQITDNETEYKNSIAKAEAKYNGFKWFFANDIPVDNVIYYDHTKIFSFGWRSPVSEQVKNTLLDRLCEFPFAYEIECESGEKISIKE